MTIPDIRQDCMVFFASRAVDLVGHVFANHLPVGRDHYHFEAVDLLKFKRLGIGRAGHAGKLSVQPEIVLKCNGRQSLIFALDFHAFLGFHRLMQPVRPAPALHHASGEFIDDNDLVVTHDVVYFAFEKRVRAQCGVEVMHQDEIRNVVEA